MNVAPSLSGFCAEMHRLAEVIEVGAEFLPTYGDHDRDGFRLSVSDGGAYVLSYRQDGLSDVFVESLDANVVMEEVFAQVTRQFSLHELVVSQTSVPPEAVAVPSDLSEEGMRPSVEAIQRNSAAIEVRLMSRLNPEWGQRHRERSAKWERELRYHYDGDRP